MLGILTLSFSSIASVSDMTNSTMNTSIQRQERPYDGKISTRAKIAYAAIIVHRLPPSLLAVFVFWQE